MKLLLISIAICSGLIALVLFAGDSAPGPAMAQMLLVRPTPTITLTPTPTVTLTPSPTPTPVGIVPERLIIPKIGVDVYVEQVGQDADGNMAVPYAWTNAGWYSYGARAGQEGNAVIAAHYDNVGGSPSVFFNLRSLEPGDTYTVVGTDSRQLVFRVKEKRDFPIDSSSLGEVFGSASSKNLNLITCAGVWDHTAHTYLSRLVVFSELVE